MWAFHWAQGLLLSDTQTSLSRFDADMVACVWIHQALLLAFAISWYNLLIDVAHAEGETSLGSYPISHFLWLEHTYRCSLFLSNSDSCRWALLVGREKYWVAWALVAAVLITMIPVLASRSLWFQNGCWLFPVAILFRLFVVHLWSVWFLKDATFAYVLKKLNRCVVFGTPRLVARIIAGVFLQVVRSALAQLIRRR